MTTRRERGQALTEFALVTPVLLFIAFAILDFGRVVWATTVIEHAAREAARYAIVHGGSPTTSCPVGPAGPMTRVPAPSAACPYPSPSKLAVVEVAGSHAVAAGDTISVRVCYGSGCRDDTDAAGATNARGSSVTVSVHSRIQLVTASFLGMPAFDVQAATTMLIEN